MDVNMTGASRDHWRCSITFLSAVVIEHTSHAAVHKSNQSRSVSQLRASEWAAVCISDKWDQGRSFYSPIHAAHAGVAGRAVAPTLGFLCGGHATGIMTDIKRGKAPHADAGNKHS